MNDKKILIALSPQDEGTGLVAFTDQYVNGENLDVTVFVIKDGLHSTERSDETIDALYLICAKKLIPLRIREINETNKNDLTAQTAFADLLITERNTFNLLSDENHRSENPCAIVVLPENFHSIQNVLLVTDGTAKAHKSIKEFFQIFSRQSREMDVTLLAVGQESGSDMKGKDELMLINYIKQYSRNIGILKVTRPLTNKLLRPVKCDDSTLVVSSFDFLTLENSDSSVFNPLQNSHSTLFLPTDH